MKCESFEERCKKQEKLMCISAVALVSSILSFNVGTWLAFVGIIMGMSVMKDRTINKYNKSMAILAVGIGLIDLFLFCMFIVSLTANMGPA